MSINQVNSNGKPDGPWEKYFSNGKLDYKGSYKNGVMNGPWEMYYSDGELYFRGSYVNGKKVGYWIEDDKHKFYVN